MRADEIQQQNDALIAERGPGLYWDIKSYAIAKDSARGNVLLGGAGGFGRGRMWKRGYSSDTACIDDAPEDPDALDDFGDTSATMRLGGPS